MGCFSNSRLRMSDRMSDRASRSRRRGLILGKDSRSRDIGNRAVYTERVDCPSVFGKRTREYTGDATLLSGVIYEARELVPTQPHVTFSPSARIRWSRTRGCPVRIVRYNSHRLLEAPLESSSAKYVVAMTVNSFRYYSDISRYMLDNLSNASREWYLSKNIYWAYVYDVMKNRNI